MNVDPKIIRIGNTVNKNFKEEITNLAQNQRDFVYFSIKRKLAWCQQNLIKLELLLCSQINLLQSQILPVSSKKKLPLTHWRKCSVVNMHADQKFIFDNIVSDKPRFILQPT